MDKNQKKPNSFYYAQIQGNPFLKPASQDTYVYNMKSILTLCNTDTIYDVLTRPGQCARKIHTLPSLHTRLSYFNVILRFLAMSGLMAAKPALFESWNRHHKLVADKLKEMEANNMPTKRQARTMIDWRQVLKVRDALGASAPTRASPAHLLLAIYTYIPPRRQQDYARMRVYVDPSTPVPTKDHNFIDVAHSPPLLYVHDYKTAKFYNGYNNNKLPGALVEIIRASCKTQPREWLFAQQPSLKPFANNNSFQKWSNRTLKQVFNNSEFTVNTLRHSFATYSNTQPFITVGQRQANAKAMGHSLTRNMIYALIKAPPGKSKTNEPSDEECFKRLTSGEVVPVKCP